jgi:hypothetical protein
MLELFARSIRIQRTAFAQKYKTITQNIPDTTKVKKNPLALSFNFAEMYSARMAPVRTFPSSYICQWHDLPSKSASPHQVLNGAGNVQVQPATTRVW